MDENLPASSGSHREDSFDIAVRGYHRVQVQEYMARSNQLLATLEQHLSVARAEAERARAEAEQHKSELERVKSEVPAAKPVHEELSGRLSQILKLASEEAAQERETAGSEIAKLRADAQETAARDLAEARREAEETVRLARETGDRELAEARREAEAAMASAKEEADRLRLASVRQTQELLDEAQRRAGAVNEVSHQRLETLTATHGEAVMRLGQIRDVLHDLLDRDVAAGSLAQVVESVVHPPKSVEPIPAPTLEPLPGTSATAAVEAAPGTAASTPAPTSAPASTPAPTPASAAAPEPEAGFDKPAEVDDAAEVDGTLADAELDDEDGESAAPDHLDDVIYPANGSATPIDLRERRARAAGQSE